MTDEQGMEFAFTRFEVKNGPASILMTRTFDSPTAAKAQFEKTLKKASEVQVREKKKGNAGIAIGEREQMSLHSEEGTETVQVIVWTSGSRYFEIHCASLRFALELEKKYNDQAD